jgi:soluble lytic murein transglycosylase-like protein
MMLRCKRSSDLRSFSGEAVVRTFTFILLLSGLSMAPQVHADIYGCLNGDKMSYVNTTKELAQRRAAGEACRLIQRERNPVPDKASVPTPVRRARPPRKTGSSPTVVADRGSVKERAARYATFIEQASGKYDIPQSFIRAVIRTESAFRFDVVSSKGAQGLMQLMPNTARAMGVNDSFDPQQNIMGGTRLLRVLANKYDGDMVKVLSAYHAGAGNVAKKGGIPFGATEGYVRAVLDHYYRYKPTGS